MEAQSLERTEVRSLLILLAATHSKLKIHDDVDQFIAEHQKKVLEAFGSKSLCPNRKSEGTWDLRIRTVTDRDKTSTELQPGLDNYEFVQAHPRRLSSLTFIFLLSS